MKQLILPFIFLLLTFSCSSQEHTNSEEKVDTQDELKGKTEEYEQVQGLSSLFPDLTADTIVVETWLVRDNEADYRECEMEEAELKSAGFSPASYMGCPLGSIQFDGRYTGYLLETPTGMAGTIVDLFIYDADSSFFLKESFELASSGYEGIDEENSTEVWSSGRCLIVKEGDSWAFYQSSGIGGMGIGYVPEPYSHVRQVLREGVLVEEGEFPEGLKEREAAALEELLGRSN